MIWSAPNPNGMRYAGVGLEQAGTILLCMFLGYQLDRWMGWENPWGLVTGAVLGTTLSMIRLFLLMKTRS